MSAWASSRPPIPTRGTRYRYYTAEQLSLLDMILLCINLGVPLKELKAYFDESGRFQNRALFEEGKRRTQEKIQELQSSLPQH